MRNLLAGFARLDYFTKAQFTQISRLFPSEKASPVFAGLARRFTLSHDGYESLHNLWVEVAASILADVRQHSFL